MQNVRIQGGPGGNALDSTNLAVEAELRMVYARSFEPSRYAINQKGIDWVVSHGRTIGQSQINSAGGIWSAFHIVCGLNSPYNLVYHADVSIVGCYVDTVGPGIVNLVGGSISAPALGAGGQFSCIIDNPTSYDSVTGLKAQGQALPSTAGIATLWLTGHPGYAQIITFPVPFTHPPYFEAGNMSTPGLGAALGTGGPGTYTLSPTALTLPADMGSAVTGWIIIDAFRSPWRATVDHLRREERTASSRL